MRHRLPLSLASSLFAPAVLAAQEPTERRDSAVALPTVSVTAARRPEPVLRVPLAVTAVPAAALRSTRGYGLDDALTFVPGVLAQSRAGGSDVRLVVRGFGARGAGDRSNAGTSRGVRVLIDGVPETEPDGRTAFDQIDLAAAEGIEVVRSNASALWGNAAGGVLNIRTIPAFGSRGVEVQPMVGGFGLRRVAARGVAPLGMGVSYADVVVTRFDGWRRHSDARRDLATFGASGALGEATRVALLGTATHNAYRIPGPLTRAELDADPRAANATYLARDERRDNRVARLAFTIEHSFDSTSGLSTMVFANPKYLQRSERNTYRDFTRYHLGGNVIGRRGVAVGGRHVGFTAGVDEAYQSGAILFYDLTASGGRGTTLRDNKSEGANNLGAFAHAELELGERVIVSGGARYDDVTYRYRSFVDPALDATKSFRGLTPKLGVTWRLTERSSAYANLGGGVEAPAGNETDPAGTFGQDTVTAINPLLEPIRSATYELGYRALADGSGAAAFSLGWDLALYTTSVRNEIVPYRGGRFYFTAGRARRSGAELGLDARTRVGLFGQAAVTLSRNRYVRYVVDSVHYGVPGATADYAGRAVVGIPDLIANGALGWSFRGPVPARLKATVEHTGSYYIDDANSIAVPSATTVSATAELARPVALGGGLTLRGFVTVENVADRRYVSSAFLNPDVVGGVPVAFEPGLPRQVVVSISLGWR